MYIIDHEKQISLIGEMKQLRKNSKSYEVYYHHPYTNQMWKSFFPLASEEDLGPKLLRHEPIPSDVEECLNICLKEKVPANAIGLGIEWSAHPELWPSIIQTMEKRYARYSRSQIKLFLDNLQLDASKVDTPEKEQKDTKQLPTLSAESVKNLQWRTRKIRVKRFFVLG